MVSGAVLVSTSSYAMWKRPSVAFSAVGRVSTSDTIGENWLPRSMPAA